VKRSRAQDVPDPNGDQTPDRTSPLPFVWENTPWPV
jgi:hypothetical protein